MHRYADRRCRSGLCEVCTPLGDVEGFYLAYGTFGQINPKSHSRYLSSACWPQP